MTNDKNNLILVQDKPALTGGTIRILTLNRPESLNSISKALLHQLFTQIKSIQKSREIRCLVVTGSSDAFCTGADLKERSTMNDPEVREFLEKLMNCFKAIEDLEVPTIASIGGYALGGGLELALCFDLRIAVNDFKKKDYIGLPETSLGIIPGAGGTQRLPRLIGPSRAKEMIFTASKYSAQDALETGLINKVISSKNLWEETIALAQEICHNAPIALRAAKQAINNGNHLGINEALLLEQDCYRQTIHSHDRKEALMAFNEKRKPVFKGE